MRNIIILRLLLISVLASTIVACDNKEEPDSIVTRFETVDLTTTSSPETAMEAEEDTITFEFFLSPGQVNDATIEIGVAPSSTAKEGEDFELSTHTVDLLAFQGQDGFTVDVYVLEDLQKEGEE